jgi:DNA-binding MarR family transcriptional regulator
VPKRRRYFKDNMLVELAVANAHASKVFDRHLVRLDLPETTHVGMLALIHLNGPLTPTALEQISALPQTTMRDRVQGLIDGGLVERRPNPSDRRSHFLDTTEAGDAFLRAATPASRATEKALDQRLERPTREYRDLVVRLRDACQEILAELDGSETSI